MFAALAVASALSAPDYGRLREDYPDVRLTDAREFGVTPAGAKWMLHLADVHKDFFAKRLKAWSESYSWEGGRFRAEAWVANWEEQAKWCRNCWEALNTANMDSRPVHERLAELYRLRCLLGDEEYERRAMPTPAPGWMFEP